MTFSHIIWDYIASRHIWIDYTLQDISRDTKNTEIGVRTKKLCKFQKLEENQQTLQHLQQKRILYFDVFRNNMSSYFIKPYMAGFYTSRDFQRYQEHQNRSLYDKVMTLRIWSKNRGLQQRRDVENQRCGIAETEHPDIATLLHDITTFGVDFGWIFSQF